MIDAVLRELAVVFLPGYTRRPAVRRTTCSWWSVAPTATTASARRDATLRRASSSARSRPRKRHAPDSTKTYQEVSIVLTNYLPPLEPRPCLASGSRARATKDGGKRFRVEYRPGGREKSRTAARFRQTAGEDRADYIAGELAAARVPDLRRAAEGDAGRRSRGRDARGRPPGVDIAEATRLQHRIQLDKLLPLIGTRRIDELTPQDFADVVAELHAQGARARRSARRSAPAR